MALVRVAIPSTAHSNAIRGLDFGGCRHWDHRLPPPRSSGLATASMCYHRSRLRHHHYCRATVTARGADGRSVQLGATTTEAMRWGDAQLRSTSASRSAPIVDKDAANSIAPCLLQLLKYRRVFGQPKLPDLTISSACSVVRPRA